MKRGSNMYFLHPKRLLFYTIEKIKQQIKILVYPYYYGEEIKAAFVGLATNHCCMENGTVH